MSDFTPITDVLGRELEKYDLCVIGGAGHIGLPLGVAFALKDVKTVLLDVNRPALDRIAAGEFPFKEDKGSESLRNALDKKMLFVSDDPAVISRSSIIMMIIGTPIDEYLNPNFHGIMKVVNNYLRYFVDGQILILRSTVFPGTTDRLRRFFEEKGKHIRISFCPERIVQGKALEEIENLPQIISGFDPQTVMVVEDLFRKVTKRNIIAVKPIEAELSKLFCNAWRYIQFSVANQFYMIGASYGLNYHDIYRAMTNDYPRMQTLPSPGFAAGPCLLKDTMQLAAFMNNQFFVGHAAMLVNEGLPGFIIQRLKQTEGNLKEKTIGILGMTFKAESDDIRDSLSFKLKKIAEMESARVLCHDFFYQDPGFSSVDDLVRDADIIILATPHRQYKTVDLYQRKGKLFIDIWNFWGMGPEVRV